MSAKSRNSGKDGLRERVAPAKVGTVKVHRGKDTMRLSFAAVKKTPDEIDMSVARRWEAKSLTVFLGG